MKKIVLFLVLFIAVISGAGYWFLTSGTINGLVKEQIQIQGGQVTGQSVKVAAVDINLLKGSGSISGLTVSNPSGYTQASVFSLGTIALAIDVASLTEEPYVIESLLISNPEVFVEVNAKGSNLKDLYAAIDKNMPAEDAQNSSSDGGAADPRIKLNSLQLQGVSMTLDLTALGNKVHSEKLSNINLGGIGGDQGVPASQLGAIIAKKITDALWDEAKQKQKEKIKGKLKEKAAEKFGELLGKFNKD